MMNRILFYLSLIILLGVAVNAEILGIDEFDYDNGPVAGGAGGEYWDWNNTAGIHTGTVSNWNTVFGTPLIQNKALFIDASGALREYNGPTEGSAEGTDERLGAFRGSGTVYYAVTMTELTENSWCGFSSYDFGTERIFFGRPGGSQYFGVEISGGGSVLSTIPVVVGQTYRLVSALDFDGDQIRLWVDPDVNDYDQGAADNTADAALAYTGSNWSTSVRLAGGGQSLWDDLVVSNSFTDISGPAIINTVPSDGEAGIEVDAQLTWQLSNTLSDVSCDVYFGDDESAVRRGDSSVFAANQSAQAFSPGPLKHATTYYWRVDVIVDGQTYPGRVRQFTTALPSFACLALHTDLNADCATDLQDILIFAEQWMGTCENPFCANMDQAGGIDFNDFARLAEDWEKTGRTIVINELLASNNNGLKDEDGDASDWIEIKNLSDAAVNLNGWSVTDDPDEPGKWKLPDVSVDAHDFLLVFASDKDRDDPTGPLHTNFQLGKGGDYLALVRPDGSISHELTPRYPQQYQDVSYGLTVMGDFQRYQYGYFSSPTPGQENGPGYIGVVEDPVEFSADGGVFTDSFLLTLTVDNPNAEIYYTTDNSEPTVHSTRYASPISVSTTTVIRARAVESNKIAGPVSSQYYVFLASNVRDFNSDLPLLVIDNFGGGALGDDNAATAHVFKPSVVGLFTVQPDGRSRLVNAPQILNRAGAKVRGISSSTYPKKGYAVEFWDEHNDDQSLAVLGMPADSDWVLYAPYYFDRAMIRNSLIYELSNQVGRYAPRTRFVEVFLNTNGGALEQGDYIGVYALTEKIKRGKDRVAVEKLDAADNAEPDVTGGYIFKNDWLESGEPGWHTSRGMPASQGGMGSALSMAYPEQEDITDAQFTYIKDFFQGFEDALYGSSGRHYSEFIDVDSWVDHNLLNMFAMNVDALRLSAYFHKSRAGKIQAGPLWDFDRSMDSYDGRDDNPYTWKGTGDGTDYFNYEWWDKLFDDPDFRLRYADRWFAMRRGALRTENINAIIDAMADKLGEAQVRNFARWPEVAPASSWDNEIQHLKDWLAQRAEWIDARMAVEFAPMPPVFSYDGSGGLSILSPSSPVLVETELVALASPVRVHIPTSNALGLTWTAKEFVPVAGWTDGSTSTGVGYERDSGYELLIGTDVEAAMYGISTSVFCRVEFVHDGSAIEALALRMKYDDAFIAYLNGTEIYRTPNITYSTPGSAMASPGHEASATTYDAWDVSAYKQVITAGTNVLAIHGINNGSTSSDMLIAPVLTAMISQADQAAPVWYTANGSDPRLPGGAVNATAIEYSGPLSLTGTTQVKARVLNHGVWSALNEAIFP
ncbi:MAG: CotH kinase family protein [Anaerohalosphaeraceae bacterium]